MVIELRTTPVITEPADKPPCQICRRQFSKYICPVCNIPYCSLLCFQSEDHADCSEKFYRREIETDIKTQPSAKQEERAKMMELLQRFESGEGLDDGVDNSDDEDDGDELIQRLEGIDLDSANPAEIWEALTEEQRTSFLKALNDPNSEFAQQLLASQELHSRRAHPWWETSEDEDSSDYSLFQRRPPMMEVPSSMLKPPAQAAPPNLVYNICAILIAYAYIIRILAVSTCKSLISDESDTNEARRIISGLVPFLVEPDSKTRFTSLSDAVTDIYSRFDANDRTPALLSILLQDATHLFRPQIIAIVDKSAPTASLDSRPNWRTLCALSDLSCLFSAQPKFKSASHVTRKLTFYIAHIATYLSTEIAVGLAAEIKARAAKFKVEETLQVLESDPVNSTSTLQLPGAAGSSTQPALIEELS